MVETQGEEVGGMAPRRDADEGGRQEAQRGASGRDLEPRELTDPREDDGWAQPESSAQKGALPDEG